MCGAVPVTSVVAMLRLVFLVLAGSLLAGCGSTAFSAPGNDETDGVAQVVSEAIGWPRQDSAMGYARAAADTTAARDGRLSVVDVTEQPTDDQRDPFGKLTFLIHLDGSTAGLIRTDPVTSCYRVTVGPYGVQGSPRRIHCPNHATPVHISAAPMSGGPQADIPGGADRLLRADLRRLPTTAPRVAQLRADLVVALKRGRSAGPLDVDAAADGVDIGVSVRSDDECLLGARTAGEVKVWRPSAVQLQPGELTCNPRTALAGWGQDAPH